MSQDMINFKSYLDELFIAHKIISELCDKHAIKDPNELLSINNINKPGTQLVQEMEGKIKKVLDRLDSANTGASDAESETSSAMDDLQVIKRELSTLYDS